MGGEEASAEANEGDEKQEEADEEGRRRSDLSATPSAEKVRAQQAKSFVV
jgi:hypothetical protein